MEKKVTLWFAVAFTSSFFISSSFGSESCNAFVDDVLRQLKEDSDFFQEPYEIPDSEKSFGIYELNYGQVYGLNTLHRVHDAVPMKEPNPHLKVYLGAGELFLKGTIQRKFLNFGKSPKLEARVPFVTVELDIIPKSDGSHPTINDFKVEEVKGMTLKVTGSGVIKDFFLNKFLKLVGKFFQKSVEAGTEIRLRDFLKHKVEDFTIPSDCLNDAWD